MREVDKEGSCDSEVETVEVSPCPGLPAQMAIELLPASASFANSLPTALAVRANLRSFGLSTSSRIA